MIAGPYVATLALRERADSLREVDGMVPGRSHLPARHRTPPAIPETCRPGEGIIRSECHTIQHPLGRKTEVADG